MTKEKQLDQCHSDFLDICFGDFPMTLVHTKVSDEITGYGTNINEKIQSLDDFIALLQMQRKESEGIDMNFQFNLISKTMLAQNNAAIFIDEMKLRMVIEDADFELNVRLSSVFEYENGQWWAKNFHGSIAQGVEGAQDTWSVNEWKKKTEELKNKVAAKTAELESSLEELKATQSQLIQSEKMASLGELTAGIAHEIQNPLNFVNNFSELSNELIDEMNEEMDKGDLAEAKVIAADIKQNLEKINHHGKRADFIVKGMLQHSRTSNSEKEPTDINALCDEFLRLSYHGLRAKDKTFNAALETDFDSSIGRINVSAQDIGRVVLNLMNNAFYAVQEKAKSEKSGFEPLVSVITKKSADNIEIRISDNGNGIPAEILDKIFQPFFTTKPTGQGTGLGLSLSYDIIKAHGGKLNVETEEGQGTTFIILIRVE